MTHASSSAATPAAARPSACPGLLRIVAASDGGICRIKLPGGALQAGAAHAIADAAERYATGVVEVTNRANLQVRGVRAGQEAALIEALVDAGLGPTVPACVALNDATASAADDVRNLMVSPGAGRDPHALFDTTALAAQILEVLQSEPRFAALSPKFALQLDGGERLAMLEHPHDIWLAAMAHPEGVRFVFGLAGCPPVARPEVLPPARDAGTTDATSSAAAFTGDESAVARRPNPLTNAEPRTASAPASALALASVRPAQVPALVRALLHTFIDLAGPEHTRMRHLLAVQPLEAVLQHVLRYLDFPLVRDPALAAWRRTPADASLRFGAHPQRLAGTWHVGGQPPLGRLDAATLRAVAALAEASGSASLRMTPWQSVLLPDVATHALPSVLSRLSALGLVCDGTQALARLIACAGSSGCAKSHADTKTDALRLAAQMPAAIEQVHLSGCPRSCAAAHRAPYTLLAVAPERYDLYRRDAERPDFGQCVAHHLTIEQATAELDRLAGSPLDA